MRYYILILSFCFTQSPITFVTTSGEEYDSYYEMTDYAASGFQIDDGYIITGTSREPAPGGGDILIMKINKHGDKIWSKSLIDGDDPHSDTGIDILPSNDGGYIIGGRMFFEGGRGTDAILMKTDEDGNELWTNYYGDDNYDHGYSTTKTIDRNYVMLVTDCITFDECSFFIVKVDDNGNDIWVSDSFAHASTTAGGKISATSDGGVVLAYKYSNQYYVEKRNVDGVIEWQQTFPDLNISDIIQTSDGGYILAGYDNTSPFYMATLVKVDNQGYPEWSFTETAYSNSLSSFGDVIQTSDGGFTVTGEVYNTDDWIQLYISNFNNQGVQQWIKVHGMSEIFDQAYGLVQTEDDGFFITGCSPCGGTNYDYLLMKTDKNGDILGCTDSNSFNYESWATKLDGSCMPTGDTNLDSGINILDAIKIINYILGNLSFSDAEIYNANVNGDYDINIQDIIVLINMILGISNNWEGITETDDSGNMLSEDEDDWCNNNNQNHSFYPAYPNPFNINTTLTFSLHSSSQVRIIALNNFGKVVEWIDDGYYSPNTYNFIWTPANYIDFGLYRLKMLIEDQFNCHGDVQYDE